MRKLTDTSYKFAVTNSVAKATDPSLENDIVVFCLPNGETEGEIYKGGKKYGGKGGTETKFKSGTKLSEPIGSLPRGYDIGGKTAQEVMDLAYNPEYVPYVEENGSVSLSIEETLREVGLKTPKKTNYTTSQTPKTLRADDETFASNKEGTISIAVATGSTFSAFDTETNKEGSFKAVATVAFTDGDTLVTTNKGRSTRQVGGTVNDRQKYVEGGANSGLVDANFHVKASNATSSVVTITYVYAIYASTSASDTLTRQDLFTGTTESLVIKNGIGKIALPVGFNLTKVEEDHGMGYQDKTTDWNKALTPENITTDANKTVSYNVWTKGDTIDETSGSLPIKITFTK